jgi:hypothetical protein
VGREWRLNPRLQRPSVVNEHSNDEVAMGKLSDVSSPALVRRRHGDRHRTVISVGAEVRDWRPVRPPVNPRQGPVTSERSATAMSADHKTRHRRDDGG